MSADTMSQYEAYTVMLKNYPDIMDINELCEILCIRRAFPLLVIGLSRNRNTSPICNVFRF